MSSEDDRSIKSKTIPVKVHPLVLEVDDDTLKLAEEATAEQGEMSFWMALRLYRKAFIYSMILCTCSIMEGYDLVVVDSLYGLRIFSDLTFYGARHTDDRA